MLYWKRCESRNESNLSLSVLFMPIIIMMMLVFWIITAFFHVLLFRTTRALLELKFLYRFLEELTNSVYCNFRFRSNLVHTFLLCVTQSSSKSRSGSAQNISDSGLEIHLGVSMPGSRIDRVDSISDYDFFWI